VSTGSYGRAWNGGKRGIGAQDSRANGRSATVQGDIALDQHPRPAAVAAFPHDPRALPLAERRVFRQRLHADQQHWLERLRRLVEPPAPDRDFPAFLLALPPFAALRRAIGDATDRRQLPTAVADELDHFAGAYRDYLKTCAGEDQFAVPAKSRC
jgi:hypothetical protein